MPTIHDNNISSRGQRNYRWADMLLILNTFSSVIVAFVGGGYLYVGPEGTALMVVPLMSSFITISTLMRYVDLMTGRANL